MSSPRPSPSFEDTRNRFGLDKQEKPAFDREQLFGLQKDRSRDGKRTHLQTLPRFDMQNRTISFEVTFKVLQ